jgi:hypothetical protein
MTEFEKGAAFALRFVADNLRLSTHTPSMSLCVSMIQDMDEQGYTIPRIVDELANSKITVVSNQHIWRYGKVKAILTELDENYNIVESLAEHFRQHGFQTRKKFEYGKRKS